MSLVSKNNLTLDWQPTASLSHLQQRAKIINQIRQFFSERQVLEVETPLLCHSTATDLEISSFETSLQVNSEAHQTTLFLQTSPEFAMKRLLAAGYGSIFQICKAFRNGEIGKKHNPEFTLLEWYRVGFNHYDLMNEVDELLQTILYTDPADRISYLELFDAYFSLNPHTCTTQELRKVAQAKGIDFRDLNDSKDVWLDLLLTHVIEPELGLVKPVFIYNYPQSQASLAKIKQEENYQVGERFEAYFKGMELANGYHELSDSKEQQSRFLEDNHQRVQSGLPVIPIDHYLLNAMSFFPECAGVALGIDRLVALAMGKDAISEVISFPITRA